MSAGQRARLRTACALPARRVLAPGGGAVALRRAPMRRCRPGRAQAAARGSSSARAAPDARRPAATAHRPSPHRRRRRRSAPRRGRL